MRKPIQKLFSVAMAAVMSLSAVQLNTFAAEYEWTDIEQTDVSYSMSELNTLIAECTEIYECNNILNEELSDLIYTAVSFAEFVDAYEVALSVYNNNQTANVNTAYKNLAAARDSLEELPTVTRLQFRTAIKNYEAAMMELYEYESWMRGTFTWPVFNTGMDWQFTLGSCSGSYGVLYQGMDACAQTINEAYDMMDSIKGLSVTSYQEIVKGYHMALDILNLYSSWTVDTLDKCTKSAVKELLADYHNVLAADFASEDATKLYDAIGSVCSFGSGSETEIQKTYGKKRGFAEYWKEFDCLTAAEWIIKPSSNVYIPVDEDGYYVMGESVVLTGNEQLPAGATAWKALYKNAKVDILPLIRVEVDDVTVAENSYLYNSTMDAGCEWPSFDYYEVISGDYGVINEKIKDYYDDVVDISIAYTLANEYIDGVYTSLEAIDTLDILSEQGSYKGNAKEWGMVYRYLYYALTDLYEPSLPEMKYSATANNGKITLNWDVVDGAEYYAVILDDDMANTMDVYTTTDTSYTFDNLTNGKKYSVCVKSYADYLYSLAYYTEVTPTNIPANVKAAAGDKQVTVSWDAVDGATKYTVYSYLNGKYTTESSTVTTNSYTVAELTNGTKYGFKVKAYTDGKWSEASDIVYATPVNPVPTGLKATAGNSTATVTWTKVNGATKYAVYLYEGSTSTCVTNTLTTNSYTAEDLTNGTKYGFKVKAYVNGKWSAASSIVYATPVGSVIPENLKIANGDGKVQVTWDTVSGATKYAVYSYYDGVYTTETTTATSNTYTVTGLTNGEKYGFKVKSYVNGKWSAASSIIYARPSAKTAPGAIKAIAGNQSAEVKWSGVIGATRYAVYKYEDGVYTCINSNIKDTNYTVTGLTNGTKYGFKVKAYVDGAWSAASVIAYATPTA